MKSALPPWWKALNWKTISLTVVSRLFESKHHKWNLFLPDKVDPAKIYNFLEDVVQVHTTWTLKLRHYIVLAPTITSPSFMWAIMANLNNLYKYNMIRRLPLPLGFAASRVPRLLNPSAGRLQWKSSTDFFSRYATHKIWKCRLQNFFFIDDYFRVEMLIVTRFMSHHVISICCIDLQVDFTKGKIPLHWSTPNAIVRGS